jgi:hypothetical protein
MIADLRLLSVAVLWLCVRSINQSIKLFSILTQVKLSRCPIFRSISQRKWFETFDFSKAFHNPKQNQTSQTMIVTHFFIASSLYAMLCYAMLCYAMLCYAMLCYTMALYILFL